LKRIAELRKLSEDHHHGLVLARHALLAEAGAGVEKTWREVEQKFEAELERHFRIEEEYLVPPLEDVGERQLIERLGGDHRELRSRVAKGADRSLTALKEFGTILEAHIRFEERELLEVAQERLSPEALKAVEKACREL